MIHEQEVVMIHEQEVVMIHEQEKIEYEMMNQRKKH
jgi:hypothetical protein